METLTPAFKCIEATTSMPWEHEGRFRCPMWDRINSNSDKGIGITFEGGSGFCGYLRTQYLMVFIKKERKTRIEMRFQKEFLGLPPLVPPEIMDLFMEQKANARRIPKGPIGYYGIGYGYYLAYF